MDLSWLQSLLLGLLSGFAELVPVSSQAHEGILLRLFGAGSATPAFELFIHIAVLLALLTGLWNSLNRLRREQRIARIPRKRRSRIPPEAFSILLLIGNYPPLAPKTICYKPSKRMWRKSRTQ